jgi:hypothetical protein
MGDWDQRGVSNKDDEKRINVASNQCITGPIDQLYGLFEEAEFPHEQRPDYFGWIPPGVFPGQVVGRVAIRDALAAWIEQEIGRRRPYSRQQKSNLMREGRVLHRCEYPVQSIPAISNNSLDAIAGELLESRTRRNRCSPPLTDCRSGSNLRGTQFSGS